MNQDIDKLFLDDEYYRQGITDQDPLMPTPLEEAILDPLAATTQAMPKAAAEVGGAALKGLIKGGVGLPADILGLATGLLNMLTVDPEQKGNLQQFIEGYEVVPFTSEKIGSMLEELGWKKYEGPAAASELTGEVIAPSKLATGAGKELVKQVKKRVRKKAK